MEPTTGPPSSTPTNTDPSTRVALEVQHHRVATLERLAGTTSRRLTRVEWLAWITAVGVGAPLVPSVAARTAEVVALALRAAGWLLGA